MSKKPKSFRLSEQAQKHLSEIVEVTGTNETAIVEMALAFLLNIIRTKKAMVLPPEPPSNFPEGSTRKPRKRH